MGGAGGVPAHWPRCPAARWGWACGGAMASAERGLGGALLLLLSCALLLGSARSVHIKKAEAAAAPGETLRYLHSAELGQALQALVDAAPPGLARLFSIGNSVEGRPLWVLRLTAGLGPEHADEEPGGLALPGRPQVKLVGNMHGDEPLARPLLLRLAQELVRGWANGEERIGRLLNTTDIYLLPSLNPDGFERAREGDCGGGAEGGRENSRGRDLNRSFPDQFGVAEPNLEPVPEVQALIAWMRRNR